jgi:cysteine desulfurase/selenocysteine lyase
MTNSKDQFPIFEAHPNLCYLDSAATTQKPRGVIDAVRDFSTSHYASVHRGLYPLAVMATEAYEYARNSVARFLNVEPAEIIFTRGTTEGLNLAAAILKPEGNVVLSELEHHSNLIPWQQTGAELRFAKIMETGEIDLEDLAAKIDGNTTVVSIIHCSNVTGAVTPIAQVKEIIGRQGSQALLVVDAAQSIPHFPVDVQALNCDFLAFSSHKAYGPTGIGVLWGRRELLEALPPYQTGGNMIRSASLSEATWNDIPWKYEAGTPNIEGAIGLAAALEWLSSQDLERLERLAHYLSKRALELDVIGEPDPRSGLLSFTVNDIHPHDLAELLGQRGICIRAGHHCTAPLHAKLGLAASNRISLGLYNDEADIDRCLAAIQEIRQEIGRA